MRCGESGAGALSAAYLSCRHSRGPEGGGTPTRESRMKGMAVSALDSRLRGNDSGDTENVYFC